MTDTCISILSIVHDTSVDGPGFRTSVYAAGCENHCPGCHNPQSWDISNGTPTPIDSILSEILSDPFADVTFSGGDPMYQAKAFAILAERIKARSNKSIWCYTGYLYEDLLRRPDCLHLLHNIDVLVDGRFVKELRDEDLLFKGSSNQRLIDVKASLRDGKTVILDYDPKRL